MSRDPSSSYYDAGGIETLDIIKAKLTPEQFKGYLLGNAIKYACRINFKDAENPGRDAQKASNYATWLAEEILKAGAVKASDDNVKSFRIRYRVYGISDESRIVLCDLTKEGAACQLRSFYPHLKVTIEEILEVSCIAKER
jgi:hypothetical protein